MSLFDSGKSALKDGSTKILVNTGGDQSQDQAG
jgi:hypothetical protein